MEGNINQFPSSYQKNSGNIESIPGYQRNGNDGITLDICTLDKTRWDKICDRCDYSDKTRWQKICDWLLILAIVVGLITAISVVAIDIALFWEICVTIYKACFTNGT